MAKESAERGIETVGVVGAGVMGQGIIQVFVQAGFRVIFYDTNTNATQRAHQKIIERLTKNNLKGEISDEQLCELLSRLGSTTALANLAEADLIVEAVYEKFGVKAEIFRQLDKVCCPETIFVSNTSSISINDLAEVTDRPDRFMGMHFMNPPTHVTLIELIRGEQTSEETFQAILELSVISGRDIIVQSKDRPAFIANRILMTAINEAIQAVYLGIASAEDVNQTILLGVGTSKAMPILGLADLIGLDVCLDILQVMQNGLGEKYAPCPLLIEMVEAGRLGYKSGEGFFVYERSK